MTLDDFLNHIEAGGALNTPEIYRLMDEMSDEARRVTCEINNSYHSQEELRAFMSRLTGKPVDETFKMFPPFYTDFGKNITIGRRVFINAGCHFQDHGGVTLGDGCLIGHNVVFATLDHGTAPEDRGAMYPAPIRLGKNVWVGSNSTILRGVTVGVTRNFAASLFRNIKYFTLRKLYLCRKWMQKRLQKTTTTGITLPNFDFLA